MEATKNILICALVIVWSVFLLMMYKKRFDTRYKLEFIPVRYEPDPKMLVCDGGLWISSRLTPNSLKEWMALIWPLSFHDKLTVAGARIRGTASLFSRLLSKSRCDAVVELKMEKGTQYAFCIIRRLKTEFLYGQKATNCPFRKCTSARKRIGKKSSRASAWWRYFLTKNPVFTEW